MKRKLIYALSFLAIVGLAFASYPFISSLSISEQTKSDSIFTCSVDNMKSGEIIECGRVSIYKRTENDKKYLTKFAYMLSDPQSIYSKQPKSINKLYRSENPDYLVYLSWAPKRGCPLSLKESVSSNDDWYIPPELEALKDLPYFTEQCEGRAWDTSGRLYHRDGYPEESNLTIPNTKWVSKTTVHIYAN